MFTQRVVGQSDNYWSWNFNTPSNLLAGAVVGGGAGPSAIYYNPAEIGHENLPSLAISASILSLQFFDAENIAGPGISADKFIFKIQPRFLSYTLPSKNDKVGMSAAVLSPVSEELEYTIQHIDSLDIIRRTDGLENYAGYVKYRRKYDETWIGFGYSRQIWDNFYIGASSFVAVMVNKYALQLDAQAYQQGDSVVVNDVPETRYIARDGLSEEFSFWDISLVFKLGAQYKSDNQRFSAGLNLTFPNIPVYGEAKVIKSFDRSNVFWNAADRFVRNEAFVDEAKKVRTRVKTPFSVAIGAAFKSKNQRNAISLTVEYFNSIDPYAVAKTETNAPGVPDYISGIVGVEDVMSYYFKAEAVTNAGFGTKIYLSDVISLLGGFRTDFTSGSKDDSRFIGDTFKTVRVHMNKFHFTFGSVLKFKKAEVISGLQYTMGRNRDINEVVNYADPVEYVAATGAALQGPRNNSATARLNEIALFLGLSVDF